MPAWLEGKLEEHRARERAGRLAILPIGAVEAHGPHLPAGTDVWIAEGMAREAARRLQDRGIEAEILPSMVFTPAGFARNFPGTLGISEAALAHCLEDLHAALARRRVEWLLVANAHFDPGNVRVLREFAASHEVGPPAVVFPDLTRRRLATRLGSEFASGACHAGQYETSLLLALRPELVDLQAASELPDLPRSLVEARREGAETFEEAGGGLAYFGYPARASIEEGRFLLGELGSLLVEAVVARRNAGKEGVHGVDPRVS